MDVYFFGCRGVPGHYLIEGGQGRCAGAGSGNKLPEPLRGRGSKLDGQYAPCDTLQQEGYACLRCVEGWTVLAFWDRSLDTRFGSNAVFIAHGEHKFERMCEIAQEFFPEIWQRFTFKIEESSIGTVLEHGGRL